MICQTQTDPSSSLHFEQALLVLDSDQTDNGMIINKGDNQKFDGIFHVLIEHSSDVEFQFRVPAPKKSVGSWKAAGEWKTERTITRDKIDTLPICSNFEYRFTTATAGARVFLGVQYEGVN